MHIPAATVALVQDLNTYRDNMRSDGDPDHSELVTITQHYNTVDWIAYYKLPLKNRWPLNYGAQIVLKDNRYTIEEFDLAKTLRECDDSELDTAAKSCGVTGSDDDETRDSICWAVWSEVRRRAQA